MTTTSRFQANGWTDTPVPGVAGLSQGVLPGTFTGNDINGDSVSSYIMSKYAQSGRCEDGMVFDGQARFEGTIRGKTGAFSAVSRGKVARGAIEGSWEIIPETATGELVGITGKATYAYCVEHKSRYSEYKFAVEL